MEYLSTVYKTNLGAQKSAGLVPNYAIYTSDARTPTDHDVMLTVTYKNWAALDNLRDKTEPVVNRVLQNTERQRDQQFLDRGAMREALGTRTYQQLYLKETFSRRTSSRDGGRRAENQKTGRGATVVGVCLELNERVRQTKA